MKYNLTNRLKAKACNASKAGMFNHHLQHAFLQNHIQFPAAICSMGLELLFNPRNEQGLFCACTEW